MRVACVIKVYPLTNQAILSTSIYVDWEGKRVLIDAGPGCTLRMMDLGLAISKVDVVLISHAHVDHFWDLVPLLWYKSIRGLGRKVKIIGPSLDAPLFDWLMEVSQGKDFCEFHGLSDGQRIEFNGLHFEAFQVQHETSKNALGFIISEKPRKKLDTQLLKKLQVPTERWKELAKGKKIDWSGKKIDLKKVMKTDSRKIVYTGDTRKTESLVGKALDADLLIAEATFISKTPRSNYDASHMNIHEALDIAGKAKVKRILLTHHSLRYPIKRFKEEAEAPTKSERRYSVHLGLEPFKID